MKKMGLTIGIKKIKGLVGLVLIMSAIVGLFFWENYGREALTYKDVLVLREDVPAGTIIEKQMLGRIKMDASTLIKECINDPETIIGKQSTSYIPKGLQLCKEFFTDAGMVTGNGEYVVSIPDDWLYTYPQTIRRGDTVYFYSVFKPQEDDECTPLPMNEQVPMMSAKVMYVKDTANREVIDVTPDRIDGSAQASKIEVIIDDIRMNELKKMIDAGYRFILMYE